MYILIVLLPLLATIISGLIGRKLGVTGSHIINTSLLLLSAIISIICFYEVIISNSPVNLTLYNWIDCELLYIDFGLLFDSLTVSMLLPVLVVSGLVHLYSTSYMEHDPHNQRFFSYLSIFTFFILILVTGDNYLVIFVGWEGIGISSYLLINFWYTRINANKAAIIALTINRVGDIFLTLGLFTIITSLGNLDYNTITIIGPIINENIITIICLLLFMGAMAKSAQIGLHIWLPFSIEGPTPVSALIHAATLVTAGVYLILRSTPLLEYSSTSLTIITWIGALTALIAATTGLFQNDLKRVIAYSTISQIGYLFIAVGLSQYSTALFHLVNHAFFKSLLFLAAGGVIHAIYDQQDIRRLGGLISLLPFTYISILIGSLSLIALPFLTGFYSKDLILELSYASTLNNYKLDGTLVFYIGSISAIFTAFYSTRLLSIVFIGYPNSSKIDYKNVHEVSNNMGIPLFILSLISIAFGYIGKDLFVGVGSNALSESLFQHPNNLVLIDAEFSLPLYIKFIPLLFTMIGMITALILYTNVNTYNTICVLTLNVYRKVYYNIYKFFNGKWLFDNVLIDLIIKPFAFSENNIAYNISKVIDRGLIEIVGPAGLSISLNNMSKRIASIDTGVLTTYALFIMLSVLVLLVVSVIGIYSSTSYLGSMESIILILSSLVLININKV